MNILVKFPSRERPHLFEKAIRGYIEKAVELKRIQFLITLDSDCPKVEVYETICKQIISEGVRLNYVIGESGSKIIAINRDMDQASDWDICVLASDDMICKVNGWDHILSSEMKLYFPDTYGVLWHWDGANGVNSTKPTISNETLIGGLNTMCIFGEKWYEKFGYIYHPDYVSLFSDNEFDTISRMLEKVFYSEIILFRHEHWSNSHQWAYTNDALMQKTQRFYQQDSETFTKRKALNFGL